MIRYIATRENITVYYRGESYSIDSSKENFSKVMEILKENPDESRIDELLALISPAQTILRNRNFKIVDGVLYYNDVQIRNSLVERIEKMIDNGESVSHLEVFISNILQNPNESSIMELYEFLEKNSLPITEDGCFLAYKKVRSDFRDIHSGTFDNSVGKIVSMARELVDGDRNSTCSTGLHVCSYEYLDKFGSGSGDTVIIVKVNPRDVVSVPVDYNNAKMRVCEYTVLAEIPDWKKTHIKDYSVDTTSGEYTRDVDSYDEDENDYYEDEWLDEDEHDYHIDDDEDYEDDFPF